MDCGSCSREIVEEVAAHCTYYYIRGNRCQSMYDDIFALRGWKHKEINGSDFELNSKSLLKSFMNQNAVFLLLTALIRNFYEMLKDRMGKDKLKTF